MAWFGSLFNGGAGTRGNEFVGQFVELGQQRLKIKRVIAEGGYGFVFVAQDVSSGKEYALKRLMAADEATTKQIVKEVSFFRKLRGHPNIVQYVAAASGTEKQSNNMNEYLILTELCTGQLLDLLTNQGQTPLAYEQVLKIFAQVCRAVAHMHKQTPPIIHRDLKVENLLFNAKGVIKLCDFGSATSSDIHPDESWTALQRSMAEDEIQRNTTPMYRSPEMIDLYSNYAVTVKSDVWALGCVLYMLCFRTHPFDDSAKLKILNANYTIPESDQTFTDFHHLIRSMLQINPADRPNTEDIYAELVSLATDRNVDLKAPILEPRAATTPEQEQPGVPTAQNAGSSVLLGNMVNKAGSLFSNIKDASSKMMHSVAGYVRNDMDITYITSRLLVMSFPADGIEATYKNNIDDVRLYLDSKHTDNYVVINISQRSYRTTKLNDRVYESGWNVKRAPPLDKLVSLCRKLNNFLKQNKKNVVVVHCLDGKVSSSLLLSSFFLFCKLFSKPSMSEDLFNLKRSNVGQPVELSPSQKRYMAYVGQLVASPRYVPHKNTVFLKSFTMSPIPIFNKARTGCRPFIEIYENDKRILTTAQEIDQMREYVIQDGKVVFQTHVRINGDITIFVHHGRSTLGGKVQGKLTSINILTLQFHTGFMQKQHTTFNYALTDLDIQEPNDKYSPNFGVGLNVKFTDETPDNAVTEPWEKMHVEKINPYVCFSSKEEYWQLYEEFGLSEEKTPLSKQMSRSSSTSDGECFTPRDSTEKKVAHSTFFNDVTWQTDDVSQTSEPSNHSNKHEEPPYEDVSNNLIDISLGSNTDKYLGNIDTGESSPVLSDSDIPQIELVDPFESLSSRSNKSPSHQTNTDILLNFDQSDDTPKITLQHPDLLSNTTSPTVKQSSPDVLPHESPLKKNRSMDDLNNEDFFGKIDDHSNSTDDSLIGTGHKPKQPFDPFMKHFHDTPRKSSSESNLLGDWGDNVPSETLEPEKPIHHASSSSSVEQMPNNAVHDPFAQFANLNFGNSTSSSTTSNVRQQPVAPGMNQSFRPIPTPSPMMGQKIPQQQKPVAPNYNVFMTPTEAFGKPSAVKQPSGWAPKPVGNNEFGDILNSQGFKSTFDAQKRTLKELRADDTEGDMDPIKRKVRDWSDGKERNIRALLTSLPTVLWESEDKWQPIAMHELIKPGQVKKHYRKACLAIHPDKHTGEPHEELARAIFIEMNEAWRLFEESGSGVI